MLERVLPLARCPSCLGPLTLQDAEKRPSTWGKDSPQIVQGTLACPACQTSYRIVDGIPLVVPT